MTFPERWLNRSPGSGGGFPLDFLPIEQGVVLPVLGFKSGCGDDSRGASCARKPWFVVWFDLPGKAGDYEKWERVFTKVSDGQRAEGPL